MLTRSNIRSVSAVAAFIGMSFVGFSLPLTAQNRNIPLHDVASPDAVSVNPFGKIVNVRQLSDGTLLVNDAQRRQVVALDVALRNRIVVLDTNSTTVGYGRTQASLIPFRADSLLLISRSGLAVIDPSGRVSSWTPATRLRILTSINGPTIGVDRDGLFVYRPSISNRSPGLASASENAPKSSTVVDPATVPPPGLPPNTTAVVRADFKTLTVKKVATFRLEPSARMSMNTGLNEQPVARTVLQPLATWDDYGVLSDGTVAIVRTDDYHIDFFRPDGTVDSTPPLPFTWHHLSDKDRQGIIDSARKAQLKAEAEGIMTPEREGAGVMAGVAVANATGINTRKPGDGFNVSVVRADSIAAGVVSARPGQPTTSGVSALPFGVKAADLEYVPYTVLPTRYPPFRDNAISVDLNDNLWIHTTAKDPSGMNAFIYDVVNNRGVLVERVRIPAGKTVAGFGREGEVYLTHQDARGWVVERTHINK